MRWLEPRRYAVRMHIADQLRNRRPGPLQVICFDRCEDDLFSLIVQYAVPLWSPTFTIDQRQDGPAGAEQLYQPVCCRLAEAEPGREFRNICGRRAGGIALQEAADRITPSACFIPKCVVNLVWKWIAHSRLARKTSQTSFSH